MQLDVLVNELMIAWIVPVRDMAIKGIQPAMQTCKQVNWTSWKKD